jgi:hypothetical protein
MRLLLLTGLVTQPTREQIGVEGMAALVLRSEIALRCGFTPDADFLAGCSDYELEAMAQAGDRMAASRAALIGVATQGAKQLATLVATQDGGQALQAVNDAEDLAKNQNEASRLAKVMGGENATVNSLTRVKSVVLGPKDLEGMLGALPK